MGFLIRRILADNLEACIWACALVWLTFADPASGLHYTLCPLKNLGIGFCPGCGLGSAVSLALHGQLAESLQRHLLGIPAIVILTVRIATLAGNAFTRYTRTDHFTIS